MIVPQKEIDGLSPVVKELFLQWRDFMYERVTFNMPDSPIHAAGHCERVLLYALIIGNEIFGDDRYVLTALAHAAVFHDTRRQDEYLDTGHGARASVYYRQFCDETPEIDFIAEAQLMMKYHDIDDMRGKAGLKRDFHGPLPRMFKLYDIFKDADALDRWRLGNRGLDPKYLRTEQAREMVAYSRRLVDETTNRMLLIIDPQNDFINGSLPISGAENAMNNLAEYISGNAGKYVLKIVTADRHPFFHCSFSDCGGEWPRHCVHDTSGAAIWQPLFRPLYETGGTVRFLYKGESEATDEYSIFKNPEATRIIRELVEEKRIGKIDICGLAGDVCVLQSLRDGMELFSAAKFNVLTAYSPSIDGGEALFELIEKREISCDR